jgi:hypothetical protein
MLGEYGHHPTIEKRNTDGTRKPDISGRYPAIKPALFGQFSCQEVASFQLRAQGSIRVVF